MMMGMRSSSCSAGWGHTGGTSTGINMPLVQRRNAVKRQSMRVRSWLLGMVVLLGMYTNNHNSKRSFWGVCCFSVVKMRKLNSVTTTSSFASKPDVAVADERNTLLEIARGKLQPHFSFPLDDWQIEAGGEIVAGKSVLVTAPTGSGKTAVGEMALRLAFESGLNSIYTTPLKALSNQKFGELRKIFGPENVGLSTGDMSINRGARITVMTTEVYRNMAWRSSGGSPTINDDNADGAAIADANADGGDDSLPLGEELVSNAVVVLDEFHYMGQPGRGGVWEECVITCPEHTQIVGLSATLPNADRLASWIERVTGRETVLVEAPGGRPVPLRYLFASKEGLVPLFRDPDAGPGAPKGLLGLRGDGRPELEPKDKKGKKKGFSPPSSVADEFQYKDGAFPKGLQVNPELKKSLDRKLQKVEKNIQRKAVRQAFGGDDSSREGGNSSRRRPPRNIGAREEQRERDRFMKAEMRRSVPSLPFLIKRLEQKELLPAIVFIFSRAGCDDAAQTICNYMRLQNKKVTSSSDETIEDNVDKQQSRKSRKRGGRETNTEMMKDPNGRSFRQGGNYVSEDVLMSIFEDSVSDLAVNDGDSLPLSPERFNLYAQQGLLNLDEVQQVASRVTAFNIDNEEIAFTETEIDRFLFGVGAHHAGMLPAHKAFAESLFRTQLMKVVFATETLAAGINMPARTTVVSSLAKRGAGSTINLLETSNLLQIAGRAGRRGMDTDGTCVILATPFEGPGEAASILTDEVKPIVSQFTPSYTLAINLIARGGGKLDVAQQLVRKSFAMWEKMELEDEIATAKEAHGEKFEEVVEAASQVRFMSILKDVFLVYTQKKRSVPKDMNMKRILETLKSRDLLKTESKSYVKSFQILELERNTLEYLEREARTMDVNLLNDKDEEIMDIFEDLFAEDAAELVTQINVQKKRVLKSERDVNRHLFTTMANAANFCMRGESEEAEWLRNALATALGEGQSSVGPITGLMLTTFAKASTVHARKTRKMKTSNPKFVTDSLIEQLESVDAYEDDAWDDMVALKNVLVAYGCLTEEQDDDIDAASSFALTQPGINVGMLGFENSLWGLVAMGGTWDIAYESKELDNFKSAMDEFSSESDGDDWYTEPDDLTGDTDVSRGNVSIAQTESENLVSLIRALTPSELAGYVSCLVADSARGGAASVVDSFQRLDFAQQRVIQSSLLAMERLMEVQKKFSVDQGSSRAQLELGTCDVVTAWAAGCSWSEALEMSGTAPGDLVRVLNRALDALRQFGNLPYMPVRGTYSENDEDDNSNAVYAIAPGIHPDIRRLCREAAQAMDRYPVKDPLPFNEDDDIVNELELIENEETETSISVEG